MPLGCHFKNLNFASSFISWLMLCRGFFFLNELVDQAGHAAAREAPRRLVLRLPFRVTHKTPVKGFFRPYIIIVVKCQFAAFAALQVFRHRTFLLTSADPRKQYLRRPARSTTLVVAPRWLHFHGNVSLPGPSSGRHAGSRRGRRVTPISKCDEGCCTGGQMLLKFAGLSSDEERLFSMEMRRRG